MTLFQLQLLRNVDFVLFPVLTLALVLLLALVLTLALALVQSLDTTFSPLHGSIVQGCPATMPTAMPTILSFPHDHREGLLDGMHLLSVRSREVAISRPDGIVPLWIDSDDHRTVVPRKRRRIRGIAVCVRV